MSFGRLSILDLMISRSALGAISFVPSAANTFLGYFSEGADGSSFGGTSCPDLSSMSEALISFFSRSSPCSVIVLWSFVVRFCGRLGSSLWFRRGCRLYRQRR